MANVGVGTRRVTLSESAAIAAKKAAKETSGSETGHKGATGAVDGAALDRGCGWEMAYATLPSD